MSRTRLIVVLSWVILGACVLGWPVTSLTIFRGEPQGVLALSWIALIMTAGNTVLTANVRTDTHEET